MVVELMKMVDGEEEEDEVVSYYLCFLIIKFKDQLDKTKMIVVYGCHLCF